MRIENGTLKLETRECITCRGKGEHNTFIPCPKDGRKQRGRKCEHCGTRNQRHGYIGQKIVDCARCDKTGIVPETITDTVPVEWILSLPLTVQRQQGRQGFAEQYLGVGIHTVVDYGDAWKRSDDDNIAKYHASTSHWVQACKVTRKLFTGAYRVCDKLVMRVCNTGYSVFPMFNPKPAICRCGDIIDGVELWDQTTDDYCTVCIERHYSDAV